MRKSLESSFLVSDFLSTKRPNPNVLQTPMSRTKKRPTDVTISAADINDKIRVLLASDSENVDLSRPCLSARLFASFLIETESKLSVFTPGRSTRKTAKVDRTEPILDLLRALVQVEFISLKDTPVCDSRKVQFSGFDCSSTNPTITSVENSHVHHEESIEALAAAVSQIQILAMNQSSDRVKDCLESLIHFLIVDEVD